MAVSCAAPSLCGAPIEVGCERIGDSVAGPVGEFFAVVDGLSRRPHHNGFMSRSKQLFKCAVTRSTAGPRSCWATVAFAVTASVFSCLHAFAQVAPPSDIKFRDFFNHPIGRQGLQMTDRLKAADGQRVRLTGYMVSQEVVPTGRFFLTPLPVQMSQHADGEADDLPPSTVTVFMPPRDRAMPIVYNPGLMQLTGVLQVGRLELEDGRVSWVQLLLDAPEPRANAEAAAALTAKRLETTPSPSPNLQVLPTGARSPHAQSSYFFVQQTYHCHADGYCHGGGTGSASGVAADPAQ